MGAEIHITITVAYRPGHRADRGGGRRRVRASGSAAAVCAPPPPGEPDGGRARWGAGSPWESEPGSTAGELTIGE